MAVFQYSQIRAQPSLALSCQLQVSSYLGFTYLFLTLLLSKTPKFPRYMIYMAFPGSVPCPGISPPQTPLWEEREGTSQVSAPHCLLLARPYFWSCLPTRLSRKPGWLWCGRWLHSTEAWGPRGAKASAHRGAICRLRAAALPFGGSSGPGWMFPNRFNLFPASWARTARAPEQLGQRSVFLHALCPLVAACTLLVTAWVGSQSCPRPAGEGPQRWQGLTLILH